MSTTISTSAPGLLRTRLADYFQLARPRLTLMALVTVAVGAILGSASRPDWMIVVQSVVGAALVAAGASALNQWLERDSDALMRRTRQRPLPAGRLRPGEVLVFGFATALGGVAYLALLLPELLAGAIAALILVIYLVVYTPLKRMSSLNTLVGAVAGALPPVIGWAAVRGSLNAEIGALFVILFLWQVPHFLAIAWLYRADYANAGLCMLPAVDPAGSMTGRQMVSYCLALVAASLAPLMIAGAGSLYFAGALLLGLGFLVCAVGFAHRRSQASARIVLRASLIYLPALLALLLLDGVAH
jgi:protoheme IX farnesyltransferase